MPHLAVVLLLSHCSICCSTSSAQGNDGQTANHGSSFHASGRNRKGRQHRSGTQIPAWAEAAWTWTWTWAEATRAPSSRFPCRASHLLSLKDRISAAKGCRNRVTHLNDNRPADCAMPIPPDGAQQMAGDPPMRRSEKVSQSRAPGLDLLTMPG